MEQYKVTGMSCAACQARVEKAVSRLPGVSACSVSLLTNTMGVEGSAAPSEIIKAVEDAGYGASPLDEKETSSAGLAAKIAAREDALKDRETPLLKRRLLSSLVFLAVLMYFSMGHMMLHLPIPAFFRGNPAGLGLLQLLLALTVMIINRKFFISGFKSLSHRAPNMDTLIALGSGAAFVYSTVILFRITRALADGDAALASSLHSEFYFESAAMILTLITVGKMLEARSKGKTTDALRSLMKLAPETATLIRDGREVTVPVDDVRVGDLFTVRPGESIPVDGIVREGSGAVNESALTGESLPVDKETGDSVSSGTTNLSGFLTCEAVRIGEDSSLARIIGMVSDAAATKAPVARLADTISSYFVPAVIIIAVVTTLIWLLAGAAPGFALARGICVLVVSCPCALGLATPVAIMVGSGKGARSGILFKTAEALQETGNIQIAALDKTGTITRGEPSVTDLVPAENVSEEELLQMACSLEQHSEHPLAKAVMACAAGRGFSPRPVEDFRALPGNGLQAVCGGEVLLGGSLSYMGERFRVPPSLLDQASDLAARGRTPLLFSQGSRFLGMIAVADTIKEDSAEAVRQLQELGIHVVMLTGDNRRTAEAIGAAAGVNEVIAGVLPDGKEAVIRELQKHGRVAMVGDGINDAPALTRADTGIAIGAGTDVAIDAADVVLMKSRLLDVPAAIRLSRLTYRNILENLFWALIYNVLLIPLAAGAWVHVFHLTMDPMFGALAMSLSSFCVVTNALRLNLPDIYRAGNNRMRRRPVAVGSDGRLLPVNQPEENAGTYKEETKMTKTMKIEGMMCMHCEASVKKALEALEGVSQADVSHEQGTAVVTLTQDVPDETLRAAVEAKDYKVLAIEG